MGAPPLLRYCTRIVARLPHSTRRCCRWAHRKLSHRSMARTPQAGEVGGRLPRSLRLREGWWSMRQLCDYRTCVEVPRVRPRNHDLIVPPYEEQSKRANLSGCVPESIPTHEAIWELIICLRDRGCSLNVAPYHPTWMGGRRLWLDPWGCCAAARPSVCPQIAGFRPDLD